MIARKHSMDLKGIFCRKVYQPLLHRRRGLNVRLWEERFRNFEAMTPEALVSHQQDALLIMLRYAYLHVPYYRCLLESGGIRAIDDHVPDISHNIPILTKDIDRDQEFQLRSRDPELQQVHQNMTGGSTGTPLNFCQDADYRAAALGAERCILRWWGIEPGDRTTAFWGADRELHDWTLREKFMMWLNRENIFDSFAMSEEKMHSFATELMRWKPLYIKGYASSLHLFARFLLNHKQFSIRPLAIRSTAETLFDFQRNDIESAFNCKVFNFYGSREVNNLAAECVEQSGLHILAGSRILEVVDANDNPVPSGQVGRLIVTDLVNRAMPFIRYENGDLGVLSDTPCACGLPYPRIDKVIGRVSDVLVGKNGQYVHGEFVTHLFYGSRGIDNFQLIQHDVNRIEIIIQGVPDNACPDMALIKQKICDRLGTVDITVRYVDGFARNSSGKHRFIISKISPFQNTTH
ncbi:MAG: phenylacetate--CoA ligase family protein [Nitrospirae bacterium]|nr:phenylacetate--CoA ligase family protein [Nitrospirota bacterium]